MHATMYQLATTPIDAEDILNEDQAFAKLNNSFGDWIDSCRVLLDKKEAMAEHLAENIFPKGMFTYNPFEASISYNGGFEEWEKEYLIKIQTIAAKLTVENYNELGTDTCLFRLKDAIDKSIFGDSLFMMTDYANGLVRNPNYGVDLMQEYVRYMKKGDKLYVMQVFDYHF